MAAGKTTPATAQTQASITEQDLAKNQQDLGWIGRLLGSKDNAPIYIAGLLAAVALIGVISIGLSDKFTPERADIVKSLGSIVLAALTFIGGASTAKRG